MADSHLSLRYRASIAQRQGIDKTEYFLDSYVEFYELGDLDLSSIIFCAY